MNRPPEDIADSISRAIDRQMYTAIVTSAILALLIAAAFRHHLSIDILGGWLLAMLAVSGLIWGLSAPLFLP